MTVPSSKTELLAAIDKNFTLLIADLAKVPPARIRESTLEGHAAGTMMSPADLVSYLVGWNELVLKWLSRDDQGLPVDTTASTRFTEKMEEDWRAVRGTVFPTTLTVRKRKARRNTIGKRASILIEARANARLSLDFVHD